MLTSFRKFRTGSGLLALVFMTGCASYPVNPPLESLDHADPYTFDAVAAKDPLNENFIILSFSGGGTRAAALAYGVLTELEAQKLGDSNQSLLDEVKVITSVSGGSYPAAYYGLYGKEKFFNRFKEEMLQRKMVRDLVIGFFLPWKWGWILLPKRGRSEYGEDYIDKHIFKGHTFKDMPRKWPYIVINSTDMSQGTFFTFNQGFFNLLCSDLNQIKVARAVMASSAFPGGFTPLTFHNYAMETCGYERPGWVDPVFEMDLDEHPQLYNQARTVVSYEDSKERPYIHLFDGGVADNLGLRSVQAALELGVWKEFRKAVNDKTIKRIVIIAVDAMPDANRSIDLKAGPPSLANILTRAATNPLTNFTIDTIHGIDQKLKVLRATDNNFQLIRELCAGDEECLGRYQKPYEKGVDPPFPDTYLIHARFDQIAMPELHERIATIPTSLELSDEDIDLLIEAGRGLLRKSKHYQELLSDLDSTLPPWDREAVIGKIMGKEFLEKVEAFEEAQHA